MDTQLPSKRTHLCHAVISPCGREPPNMFKCEAISPEDGSNACVVPQHENVGLEPPMK